MKIGPYEVLDEVGRGGVGVVYRARTGEGRIVALKLLLDARAERRARFERERRLLATFDEAQGFVPLLDAGDCPRGPYVVMPFLAGGTLRDRLRRGPLPVDETIALGAKLATALGVAHGRGVVHRDVKPENVLYDERGARRSSPTSASPSTSTARRRARAGATPSRGRASRRGRSATWRPSR